jgi:hypothetical protein
VSQPFSCSWVSSTEQRPCQPFWICLLSKCSHRNLPPRQITIREKIAFLLPKVSLQINRSALIRREMNGFAQMSCNLGLQISFSKYLFLWDIPSKWFWVLMVFVFLGGWHVWGLLNVKKMVWQ